MQFRSEVTQPTQVHLGFFAVFQHSGRVDDLDHDGVWQITLWVLTCEFKLNTTSSLVIK